MRMNQTKPLSYALMLASFLATAQPVLAQPDTQGPAVEQLQDAFTPDAYKQHEYKQAVTCAAKAEAVIMILPDYLTRMEDTPEQKHYVQQAALDLKLDMVQKAAYTKAETLTTSKDKLEADFDETRIGMLQYFVDTHPGANIEVDVMKGVMDMGKQVVRPTLAQCSQTFAPK